MGFRSLEVRAATFSEETRSVEAVISTETPVAMPDWHRMEMIPEVLVASGAEYPGNRQVPFLDSHQRRSVKDQLGSARDITVDGNQITAKLVFRKASESEEALAGVRDGHITDVSVGYEVLKRQYVASGDKKTIAGRSYEGPVNVVTKWRLREVSLTPIGADAQAKLRGLDPAAVRFQSSEKENFQMNPELRKMLESRGMPATLTDDEAQRWLVENTDKLAPAKQEEQRQEQGQTIDARSLQKMIAEATAEAIKQETAARAAFEKEVASLCELAGLPDAAAHCRTLSNVDDVRNYLKAEKAKDEAVVPFGSAVRFVSAGADRLKNGIRGALINKAVRYAVNDNQHMLDRYLTPEQRTDKDAENFRHATLLDMATEFVRSLGIQTLGMTREDIAICAMFGPEKAGIRGFRGDNPYHTTGSFANLTLDAINKSMMVGYQEVPATWRGPMRQGESVADFKQINRLRLGGIPNLPVWNDVDEPSKASFADAKESYAVEARSIGVDFSYKLLVNDDMSALTRVPLSLGDAAARTVNAVAWSQITSNPTMADGVALFAAATGARKRTNLTTGSGAPSVSTLGTLTNLMRQMRGENTPDANEGPDILNLQPSYLVVPSALETTALQLVNSAYDPSASVNNTVYNPARTLTPVIEPLLDANSTTAWYLFAAPVRIDTVEVTFLQGQETPQVRSVMDEHTLAMTYYVLQSVAAKALNHRGVQRHNNA
jgi:hypothetical protein